MSYSHEEALAESIEDALRDYSEKISIPRTKVIMGTVLDVVNDYVHGGVPVITTQVILNEGDWVSVHTYGEFTTG